LSDQYEDLREMMRDYDQVLNGAKKALKDIGVFSKE